MGDIRRSVRDLFLQGVEAVNNAANHVANATRSKVDEMNLRNRRRELMETLAGTIYEQWQQGLELPEKLTETLEQIRDIEEQLADMESQQESEEAVVNKESAAVPSIVVDEKEAAPEASKEPVVREIPTIQIDEPKDADTEE